MLPVLPVTHKDYYRNLETRLKIQTQNAQNEEKRFQIRMSDWTTVYSLFKTSTEKSAPLLSRDLLELCDMAKVTGDAKYTGCFDGPRASWQTRWSCEPRTTMLRQSSNAQP